MAAQPIPTTPQDDPAQQAADAHQQRQALRDLLGMGTDFARLLHGQATTPQPAATPSAPAPVPDSHPDARPDTPAPATPTAHTLIALAAAFDQIARAVRRNILLARSLDRPAPPAPDPAQLRTAARKRILRETEDTIQRAHNPDSDIAESLQAELRDRLDAPDLEDDLATRPIPDIITEIRRDLGLDAHPGTRPFKRRTPADLQTLHARAAAPPRQPSPGPQSPANAAPTQPAPPNTPATPRTHSAAAPPHAWPGTLATIPRPASAPRTRWHPPPEP